MHNLTTALLRFFADAPELFPQRGRVLVACSGGPDSVALARALVSLSRELPQYEFHLAHVNHKLRGSSSEKDARFVRGLAKELGWELHEKNVPVRISSGNLEETARVRRYDALTAMAKKSGARAVLTAHTQDDQAETILMNLLRGSGATGLGGMNPARVWRDSGVVVGRPFLAVSKADVNAFLKKEKAAFRTDESNKDEKFFRNFLRKKVMPQLRRRSPGFEQRLANTAAVLREEEAAWGMQMEEMSDKFLRPYRGGQLLDFEGVLSYSAAAVRRFLRRVMGGDALDFNAVERLKQWMASPPNNGRIWQGRLGWVAERLSKSKGAPSAKLFWIRNVKSK